MTKAGTPEVPKKERASSKKKATETEAAVSTPAPVAESKSKKTKRAETEESVTPAPAPVSAAKKTKRDEVVAPVVSEVEVEVEQSETEAEAAQSDVKVKTDHDAVADEHRKALYAEAEKMKTDVLASFVNLTALLRASKTADARAKKFRDKIKAKEEKRRRDRANKPQVTAKNDIPVLLSDDMCEFMNVPSGSIKKPREVMDFIKEYANTNDLKGIPGINDNKRLYNCDAKLTKLVGADVVEKYKNELIATGKATSGLDFFRLTNVVKHHFTPLSTPDEQ